MLKLKKLFIFTVLLAGCESTLQDPVTPASESPRMDAPSPVVAIESLRGGEYVKGGAMYKIYMVITDPTLDTNSSTIEYSRDGGSTWTVAQSSTGQDGSSFATNDGEESVFNWSVPRETDCSVAGSSDGNNYKLRVTTRGRPDAFPTIDVSPATFTVDSCAPTLSGINFGYTGNRAVGFADLLLPDMEDVSQLSPIRDICVKSIIVTEPTETDSCWLHVNSLTANTNQSSYSNETLNYFLGFNALSSMTATIWVRDQAFNQSELTLVASMPVGRVGTDITDTFNYDCANGNCASMTATGGVASSQVVVNSVSVLTKADAPTSPYDSNTSLLDPQMFVVNSRGTIYYRDKVRGIVQVTTINGASQTVLVPIAGSSADGALPGTGRVKKPMRLALDSNENLIILDYDKIRRVTFDNSTGNHSISTIVGGGSDTSGTVKVATDLQIDYHDNLLWYGTFQVLPNDWIVFNSEDPHSKLSDSFRLRVYRPGKYNEIVSITLSGTGVDIDANLSVDDLWPYGGMAVTYDSTAKNISRIYARLCDDDTACAQHSLGTFDSDGIAVTSNVAVPDFYSNNYLFTSRYGKLHSMNRFTGFVRRHNGTIWQTQLGKGSDQNPTSLCAENTRATSCDIDLWDAYVGPQERMYFIDKGAFRFTDGLTGRVFTLFTLVP